MTILPWVTATWVIPLDIPQDNYPQIIPPLEN